LNLRVHFLNYPIKKICLDNADEFISHAFNEYCMLMGIEVEHPITYLYSKWTCRIIDKMSKIDCKTITYES